MDSGKIIIGVLSGLAVGSVLGILLAPNKGVDTRKKILGKSDEIKDSLNEKLSQIIDSITEKFENAKDEIEDDALKTKVAQEDI